MLALDASPVVRAMAVWALRCLMADGEFADFAAARPVDVDPDVRAEWKLAGVKQ